MNGLEALSQDPDSGRISGAPVLVYLAWGGSSCPGQGRFSIWKLTLEFPVHSFPLSEGAVVTDQGSRTSSG